MEETFEDLKQELIEGLKPELQKQYLWIKEGIKAHFYIPLRNEPHIINGKLDGLGRNEYGGITAIISYKVRNIPGLYRSFLFGLDATAETNALFLKKGHCKYNLKGIFGSFIKKCKPHDP